MQNKSHSVNSLDGKAQDKENTSINQCACKNFPTLNYIPILPNIAARLLGVPSAKLMKLSQAHKIHSYRLGQMTYFKMDQIAKEISQLKANNQI